MEYHPALAVRIDYHRVYPAFHDLLQTERVLKTLTFTCPVCSESHSLDSQPARQSCLELMDNLHRTARIDFESAVPDPRFTTEPLFSPSRGQMFGVLVCAPKTPGGQNIILKAFSGQYNGVWNAENWVPPILDSAVFAEAVAAVDPLIKKLGAEIECCRSSSEKEGLIKARRKLSHRHMNEIHEMYTIRNFAGGTIDLFTLFADKPGIPAGTGDCCAPKLLNHAALMGYSPLSLAEFFWGRENRSGTKQHACFYPPCREKCEPLLGYMLHGLDSGNKGKRTCG